MTPEEFITVCESEELKCEVVGNSIKVTSGMSGNPWQNTRTFNPDVITMCSEDLLRKVLIRWKGNLIKDMFDVEY